MFNCSQPDQVSIFVFPVIRPVNPIIRRGKRVQPVQYGAHENKGLGIYFRRGKRGTHGVGINGS